MILTFVLSFLIGGIFVGFIIYLMNRPKFVIGPLQEEWLSTIERDNRMAHVSKVTELEKLLISERGANIITTMVLDMVEYGKIVEFIRKNPRKIFKKSI